MDYNLQIQKILVKLEAQETPDDKIKLLKEAIQLADSHNDIEWGFDLRKDLIDEEKATSRCSEGMPALVWLLEARDQNTDLFNDTELMMEYKWMMQAACRNVNISAQQLDNIFEDYKTRLQRSGYTLHSYYRTKTQLAFMLARFDEARKYVELLEKEDHDDVSFCTACDINDRAELEFRSGNIDTGLMVAADLFSKKEWCKYAPFETACNCINILAGAGYTDKAAELFTIADKELQENPTDMSRISFVGKLIQYLTGIDKERAWEYFQKYVSWSVNCEDYYAYIFGCSVLPLLNGGGTRTMQLNSALPWYREDNMYNITDMYNYYYKLTSEMAVRFDERHSTTVFTQKLKEHK